MSAAQITLAGQETEVSEKARRRRFTAEYKRRIVKEADACRAVGEVGALLRREGLYSSHLTVWRAARDRGELAPGATTKKRGPQAKAPDPRDKRITEQERQIARLTARAERAEAIAEIQKNDRARPSRAPVRPETPDPRRMRSREEWPFTFWCSANP